MFYHVGPFQLGADEFFVPACLLSGKYRIPVV
jgi:hypothetical protein